MCVLLTQSCRTLYSPMVCSPPGSSVHGILQARILEWVAILFSKAASQPRDQTWVSHIAGTFFTVWATKEDPDDGDSKVHFNFRDVKIWKKKKVCYSSENHMPRLSVHISHGTMVFGSLWKNWSSLFNQSWIEANDSQSSTKKKKKMWSPYIIATLNILNSEGNSWKVVYTVAVSTGPGASQSQFAVLFGLLLALRLWSNRLSSLSVSFLIYEVGIIRTLTV